MVATARRARHSPEQHRSVTGGQARAAVFGLSDGLVSNVSLVLGVAGAGAESSVVWLTGLSGAAAGALSMAAGEWVSMRAQRELLEHELEVERRELAEFPDDERRELAAIYESRGVGPAQARELASAMMREPELALATHAREELGIDPDQLGSPVGAAVWSFACFALGALVPLVPWLVWAGVAARAASLAVAVAVAVALGLVLARTAGRPPVRAVARQVGVLLAACAVTTAVGSVVGVSLS